MTPDASDPAGAAPRGPGAGALHGIRVLDLTRVLAGPLCAQMLGDHGAEVIKIEPPAGDETRRLGPPFDANGDAGYFTALNRNKRAIALDLSRPDGRDVLLRLLENADVLLENALPGTMERWGLGYETTLAARFPRLVYGTISGFGADGPLGGLPGYDAIAQAMGGAMSVLGTPQTGPMRTSIAMIDIVTGYNMMVGVLLALSERAHSGRGQRVEATLYDTTLSMLIPYAANWMLSGRTPGPVGNAHVSVYPYDRFAIGDAQVFLGVVSQAQFGRLCDRIGRPDLPADPRFRDNVSRSTHREALRAEIERALYGRDPDALCEALMADGVPAGKVRSVPEAFAHPHTAHRAMDVRLDGYRGVGVPVRLDRTPGAPRSRPPRFAEHTAEILAEIGYSPGQIEALRRSGAAPVR